MINNSASTEPSMTELKDELQFRTSLLRLMTVPHGALKEAPANNDTQQLEDLAVLVPLKTNPAQLERTAR